MNTMNHVSNIVRSKGDPKVLRTGPSSLSVSDKLAKTLGWFALGLGLAELIAPGRITRALGMQGTEGLVRAYGAREIASGVLTLSTDKQVGLWTRVAGDGMDVTTLLTGLREDNPKRANVSAALLAVLGVTLLDLVAAQGATTQQRQSVGRRRLYHDRSGFPMGLQAAAGAAKTWS
jgi:hypothetical protein